VKLGTENKKKTILACVLVLAAAGVLGYQFFGSSSDSPPAQSATPAPTPSSAGVKNARKPHTLMAHSLDPTLRFDLLKSSEDMTYKGTGRNIFRSEAPPPPQPIPQPVDPAIIAQQQAPAPPPPSGLKFYGFAGPKNGSKKVFLLKGEDIFLAKEGDVVDRRYKIVHVGNTSVDVQDVLTNHTETLPLIAG
jgi:hypothetical protein